MPFRPRVSGLGIRFLCVCSSMFFLVLSFSKKTVFNLTCEVRAKRRHALSTAGILSGNLARWA